MQYMFLFTKTFSSPVGFLKCQILFLNEKNNVKIELILTNVSFDNFSVTCVAIATCGFNPSPVLT